MKMIVSHRFSKSAKYFMVLIFCLATISLSSQEINNTLGMQLREKVTTQHDNNYWYSDVKGNLKNVSKTLVQKHMGFNSESIYVDSVFSNSVALGQSAKKYYYTQAGHILEILGKILVDGVWVNYTLDTYLFNNNGFHEELIRKYWDNTTSQWKNQQKYFYTYDNFNNRDTTIWQFWINNEWESETLERFTYNSAGHFLTMITEYWEDENWEVRYQLLNTYTSEGEIEKETWQQSINGEWLNIFRNNYTYYPSGIEETYLYQEWENQQWQDLTVDSSFIDTGNVDYTITRVKQNGLWSKYRLTTFSYYQSNNVSEILSKLWEEDTWKNYTKMVYDYYDQEQKITANSYIWNDSWIDYDASIRVYYQNQNMYWTINNHYVEVFYDDETTVVKDIVDCNPIIFYPNPAHDVINLQLNNSEPNYSKIVVYSLNGNFIADLSRQQIYPGKTYQFEIGHLATGIYLLTLTNKKQTISKKLIIK